MFKMTVEDVFVIRNRGVVATGRVESGTLRVGDTVHINGGPGVAVDAIEKFRKQIDEATDGRERGRADQGHRQGLSSTAATSSPPRARLHLVVRRGSTYLSRSIRAERNR